VTDAAEERQQQLGHRVVAAFQRRGQAEPFVVLREHRPSQRPATETVALVGDEEAAGAVGRHRLVRRRRVAGGDEHLAGARAVRAAVTQATDPSLRQRRREPPVPLLHEHA
jgi:hypothetical protein